MKQLFLILVAAILFSFDKNHADDELIFKTQIMPEKKYNQTIEQTAFNEIKYIGSKDFLEKIKDKGIQNPTITNTHSITEAVFKTGKANSENLFPVTIEFVKTTSSDGKKAIPDGTIIYGHSTTTTLPKFDSIVSSGLDEKIKKTVLKTIESTFEQLSFPERKVKVGETFIIKTPLTLPVAGINIQMDITTKYKLLSIKNGIADIDIVQVYTMSMNSSKFEMKGKGSGKGKMTYDAGNSYMTKYVVDIDMRLGMKLDEFALDLKMQSGIVQTIAISKNEL